MENEEQLSGENQGNVADFPDSNVEIPSTQEGAQQEPKMVPLSALQSSREQQQKLKEEIQMIKDHVALLQAQRSQPVPQKEQEDGSDDGDVVTLGDLKKFSSKQERKYQQVIKEMQMSQKYPDYQQVIQKYLPAVLKNNPSLTQTLTSTEDYELAYYLAKNSDEYKAQHKKEKKSEEAKKILQNSQQTGSLSSMGASTPISQAKRYKDMSDDEFRNMVNKNLGYA